MEERAESLEYGDGTETRVLSETQLHEHEREADQQQHAHEGDQERTCKMKEEHEREPVKNAPVTAVTRTQNMSGNKHRTRLETNTINGNPTSNASAKTPNLNKYTGHGNPMRFPVILSGMLQDKP